MYPNMVKKIVKSRNITCYRILNTCTCIIKIKNRIKISVLNKIFGPHISVLSKNNNNCKFCIHCISVI